MRWKVSSGSSTSSNQPTGTGGWVTVGVRIASYSFMTRNPKRVAVCSVAWAWRNSGAVVAKPRARSHLVRGRSLGSSEGSTGCMHAKQNHSFSNSVTMDGSNGGGMSTTS